MGKTNVWSLGLCLLLAGASPLSSATSAMPKTGKQTSHHFKKTQEIRWKTDYWLYLPEGYDRKGKTLYPLILFLHGMGERGLDVNKVKVHGPPKIAPHRTHFPFVVVSPQGPPGEWWQADLVLSLLDEVVKKHRIDPDRIYLTGLSMGGYGSWELALKYPERWAAVAPICGGGNPLYPLGYESREKKEALKRLPFWVFHGEKDNVVQLEESRRMVEALKRAGNQPKFTIYPGIGHDSWTETYNDPRLYEWFLEHKRRSGRAESK